jgi:hypothetical protein
MKWLWGLGVLSVLAVVAFAQDARDGLAKPKSVQTIQSANVAPGSVTHDEAYKTFVRVEEILRDVTGADAPATSTKFQTGSAAPATRAQIVEEFSRLYDMVRPRARLTPRPVPVDEAVLQMDGPQRNALIRLIRLGAVATHGPLATGPQDGLEPKEFGDAIGFFIARMGEITHMPSRFSPPLMGGGE